MTIVDTIMDLFARRGAAAYHGEAVSQAEHALQAADLAQREGEPDRLVVAALLHDVGHLLDGQDEDIVGEGLAEEEGGAGDGGGDEGVETIVGLLAGEMWRYLSKGVRQFGPSVPAKLPLAEAMLLMVFGVRVRGIPHGR